jgi:diguanylate cyclase (GGDEF)-like protein
MAAVLLAWAVTLAQAQQASTAAASVEPAWAALATPVFERLDPRELPHRVVTSLAQDASGFLWVGTQGGLARFDGYRYRVFRARTGEPDAMPDGYIYTLLVDDSGHGLWLGTGTSGLVHFDCATEKFTALRTNNPSGGGLKGSKVMALAHASEGALWVGSDMGLSLFVPQTGRFTPVVLAPQAAQPVVQRLLVDRRQNVWAGTSAGLYVRWAGQTTFQALDVAELRVVSPAGRVHSLGEDAAGRVWVGGIDALVALDEQGHVSRQYRYVAGDANSLAHGQQAVILEVNPGTLWVGSSQQGISSIELGSGRITRLAPDANNPFGLRSADLSAMLRDRSGLVWLGNWDGGLLRYNPFNRGIRTISARSHGTPLVDQDALALAVRPGGQLWVGGKSGALVALEPGLMRGRRMALRADSPPIWALANDGKDMVVGTEHGLCVVNAGQARPQCPGKPVELVDADVRDVALDGSVAWLGTSLGLLRWDRANGRVQAMQHGGAAQGLLDNAITAVFLDNNKRVWMGLRGGGVDVLDPASGRMRRILHDSRDPHSLGPGTIYAFLQDRRGRLWLGAAGGGLNVLEQMADEGALKFKHLGVAQGLPHENVYALAQDPQGHIWASTPKGLAVVDPQRLTALAMGLGEGVAIEAYWPPSVAQDADGTLFFGGIGGVTVVLPDELEPWVYAPPLVLTDLQIGHQRVLEGQFHDGKGGVALPVDDRTLSAEFAALDYSSPEMNRYQYRLNGFDRDWISANAEYRVASYTNLPPGRYVLEVRGSNRRGQWSPRTLTLRVDVPPAWFETWWLRLAGVLLLFACATMVARWRARALLRRQHELEALVEQRTNALSQANAALAGSTQSLLNKNRDLERLSTTDRLTSLFNRHKLDLILQEEHARSQRYGGVFSIALMDIDHFKSVNDTYGHHVGDAVLLEMAQLLANQTREIDVVGRWGGEEFLLVYRETALEGALQATDHLRKAIAAHEFRHVGYKTASFGVTAYGAGDTVTDMMARADAALYRAKANGRDRVESGEGVQTGGVEPRA